MSLGSLNTLCVCPTVDGSIMIVVVRVCIVASVSVSAPCPLLVVGGPSVLCCCIGAECPNLETFLPACAESRKNS